MPRPQREPHEFDDLPFEQLADAAGNHDLAGWVSQRQGFVELRDLTTTTATAAERALSELRQSWTGNGAEAFTAEFAQIIDLLTGLRDSAASNADGMREMALVLRDTRDEAELLRSEDKDWQDNPEADSPETISKAREEIRKDMRDKLKDADEAYQHLAGAYLLPPPEPLRLSGMESIVLGSSPSLQSSAQAQPTNAPPPEPLPTAGPPPTEPVPPPMVPMGGVGMVGDTGGATAARTTSNGPTFAAPRNVPVSRMRAQASRQQLHNQSEHDAPNREDPNEKRRAVHAENDSPFIPTESSVVPPVITGGMAVTGPHDSGPVIGNTIPQRFPEYGYEEPRPDLVEEYEDGSSVEVVFPGLNPAGHDRPTQT